MPKIGFVKLNKDDLNSVKIHVFKPEGGVSSLWSWLIKKDKLVDLKHKAFDKNSFKLKLSAADLQKLKANGIDIEKIQNHNKINKVHQLQNKQKVLLPREQCLKEKVKLNNYMMPTTKRGKPENNSKAGAKLIVSPNINLLDSKNVKDNFINNSTSLLGVKSQKSLINVSSYKVGIKSNIRSPHKTIPLEGVQANDVLGNSQRRQFTPAWKRSNKFSGTILNELNNKDCVKESIPILLSKIKCMEEQISDIESKTKKLDEDVSEHVLKASTAKCNLHSKNSPHQNVTKNVFSHKIYSKNIHSSRALRNKRTNKKSKNFLTSSSEQLSKNNKLKNKGYPFEKFSDTLNNSLMNTKTISAELFNDKISNVEKNHSLMTSLKTVGKNTIMDDTNSSITQDMFVKLLCTNSMVNHFTTNKHQEITMQGKEPQSQIIEGDLISNLNLKSRPPFNWKHKSLFTASGIQSGEIVSTAEEDSKDITNFPLANKNVNQPFNTQQILSDKFIENFLLKQLSHTISSELEPLQCLNIDSTDTKLDGDLVIQNNVLEKIKLNQVNSDFSTHPCLEKCQTSQVDIISGLCNVNSLMSSNGAEIDNILNGNGLIDESVPPHSPPVDALNKQKMSSETFVMPSLKSDCAFEKSDLQIDLKPTMKNQSQTSKESEEQIRFSNLIPNGHTTNCHRNRSNICHPNTRLLKSVQSFCDELDSKASYANAMSSEGMNDREKILNQQVSNEKTVSSSKEIKEPKINITIFVQDNLKGSVNLKSDFTNQRDYTEQYGFCNIHCKKMQNVKEKRDKYSIDKSHNCKCCSSCYSLGEIETDSASIQHSLGLSNQRKNSLENNFVKVSKIKQNHTLGTLKPTTCFGESLRNFRNEGRYLYQKERNQYGKLNNKQYTYNVIEPISKIKTNLMNKHAALQPDKDISIQESISKGIMAHGDFNYETDKNEERVNTSSENNVEEAKYNSRKPLLMLADHESGKLDLIKTERGFGNKPLERNQNFFRIVDKEQTGSNPVGKCVTEESQKSSSRYGLTLSQEPILEESECGISSKNISYKYHQSDKGDNIEIQGANCEYSTRKNTMNNIKDNVYYPLSVLVNGNTCSHGFPVGCKESPSVFVQTDWSFVENTVDETAKQTVSSQTDIVMAQMAVFDKEMIDKYTFCDLMTDGYEDTKIKSSECDEKKHMSLANKMKKENITELKPTVPPISVMRDCEKSVEEVTPRSATDPKNIITATSKTTHETPTPENNISSEEGIDQEILKNYQSGFFSNISKIDPIYETTHLCTARCFYSESKEADLPCKSELKSNSSTLLQGVNYNLFKPPESDCFNKGNMTKINTILELRESKKNFQIDSCFEETMEESEPDLKYRVLNPEWFLLKDIGAPHTNSVNINREFVNKVMATKPTIIREPVVTQQNSSLVEINTSIEPSKDISSNVLNICKHCFVDCKLNSCINLVQEYSIVSYSLSDCPLPENIANT